MSLRIKRPPIFAALLGPECRSETRMSKSMVAIVFGVLGVGLGFGGSFLLPSRPSGAPTVNSATLATPVAAVALTVDAGPSNQALQTLRSIVQVGMTYQAYSAKVGDAKVEVDRYLRTAPASVHRESIDMAMRYHVAASVAWTVKISDSGSS